MECQECGRSCEGPYSWRGNSWPLCSECVAGMISWIVDEEFEKHRTALWSEDEFDPSLVDEIIRNARGYLDDQDTRLTVHTRKSLLEAVLIPALEKAGRYQEALEANDRALDLAKEELSGAESAEAVALGLRKRAILQGKFGSPPLTVGVLPVGVRNGSSGATTRGYDAPPPRS